MSKSTYIVNGVISMFTSGLHDS